MEVLPLTLPGVAGRSCDCAGQKEEGGEISEKHFGGFEV